VARFSDLPYLLPLLAMSPTPVPYLIVVADKVGARLHVVDRTGVEVADTTVRGADTHVSGGGRGAQGGVESRTEETLRQNAKEIAAQTTTSAQDVSAELVVLAGEVQARAAVRAALPAHVERLVTDLDVDANGIKENPELLADGVARMLAQEQAAEEVDAIEQLRVGAAHGMSREGLPGVLDALRTGQVGTLLVTDPLLGDREVWLGADRSQVTTDRSTVPEAGDDLVRRRADEAVPAAAIATSAEVLVLTGQTEVADGIAALLRYA
jgi:stalled ribosome rescue protein Dom34